MGRLIDLTGKRFAKLVVTGRAENNVLPSGLPEPMWHCVCDCGELTVVRGAFLRTGHTKSCGCGQTGHNAIDLSGMRYHRVLVIDRADDEVQPSGRRIRRWNCLCDCGKMFVTRGNALSSNHVKSCGCRKKQLRIKDMVGRQFGKLTVIERAEDKVLETGLRYVRWHCRCECGADTVVRGTALRGGSTMSCGCHRLEQLASKVMSRSEVWVNNYLTSTGVTFTPQASFPGLMGTGGRLLSYDFAVQVENVTYLIECHGLQHYQPIKYFGGAKTFETQQEHDRRKRNFAKQNDYRLLEIPVHGLKENEVIDQLKSFGL